MVTVVWLYSWEGQASVSDSYNEVVVGVLHLVACIYGRVKNYELSQICQGIKKLVACPAYIDQFLPKVITTVLFTFRAGQRDNCC